MWGDLLYRYLYSGLIHFFGTGFGMQGQADRSCLLQVQSALCISMYFYILNIMISVGIRALTSRKDNNIFILDRINLNALYGLITIYGMY